MGKGIAEQIDALIKARIKPLEQEVALLKKRADIQADTLEKQDGEIEELYHRLHELEM